MDFGRVPKYTASTAQYYQLITLNIIDDKIDKNDHDRRLAKEGLLELYKTTNIMTSNERPSNNVKLSIPHIRQRFSWDCGIACVLMLLSEQQRKEFLEGFSRICLEEGFGRSTWTIDLCYLLKRFNIKHRMYTSRQAANQRALSEEVAERIRNRFRNASYNGITVVDGVLSTEQLVTHVATAGPAIVLVDAALLSCDLCRHNKLTSEFRRIFGGKYRGHYILALGCAGGGGRLRYRDPARPHPLCATTRKGLRAATTAHTDGDVILVYNHCID